MDHTQLIRAMQERQKEALPQFQTAFAPLVKYILAPILPDERDREECLSDVFLRAWDAIPNYDPTKGTITAWLGAIARNAALNRRRGVERRREDGPPDETIPAVQDGPEEAALKAETVRALWREVDELPRRDRDLFLRKYYYYQSTAQIAAEMGLSERAVEGKLYRIRKRLQDKLGGVYRG